MDTVLGVSMAPATVRIVLIEGENADGVTVDEENFAVVGDQDAATFSGPDQVVAAILGTREGADEAGYQLLSTGVTWSDQREGAALRDALTARKVENVMLVSSFLAAAALAQSIGSATGYARAALLFVEPDSATLAVVDTADGSITDVQRELLPDDDDQAVATLLGLVSAAENLEEQPEGVLVVGSGVDIPLIKPALEGATSLPLSVPDQPDMALARGAALASANAPLFASSTAALAYALDPGTGSVNQHALAPEYLAAADPGAGAEAGAEALAYSAVADDSAAVYTQQSSDAYTDVDRDHDFTTGMYPDFSQMEHEHAGRTPFFAAMSVLVIFVVGVMALVISLAFSIRPSASSRPSLSHNVVAPARPLPAPLPRAAVAAPAAPAPVQAPIAAPARVPAAIPAPAPVQVPGPAPLPAPIPIPIPMAPIIPPLLPGLFGPPQVGPPMEPRGGDHGGGGWGRGGGDWGRGGGGWGRGGGGWGHGGGGWGHGGGGHGRW